MTLIIKQFSVDNWQSEGRQRGVKSLLLWSQNWFLPQPLLCNLAGGHSTDLTLAYLQKGFTSSLVRKSWQFSGCLRSPKLTEMFRLAFIIPPIRSSRGISRNILNHSPVQARPLQALKTRYSDHINWRLVEFEMKWRQYLLFKFCFWSVTCL